MVAQCGPFRRRAAEFELAVVRVRAEGDNPQLPVRFLRMCSPGHRQQAEAGSQHSYHDPSVVSYRRTPTVHLQAPSSKQGVATKSFRRSSASDFAGPIGYDIVSVARRHLPP